MSQLPLRPPHPVLALVEQLGALLDEAAEVDPGYLATADKEAALVGLTRVGDRLAELRLRVLGSAGDVAGEHGAHDAAAWLAAELGLDRREARRDLRTAEGLGGRPVVARALREGTLRLGQAAAVVRALEDLPGDLPAGVPRRAEEHLVAAAGTFSPAELRVMGRRVLDVVAPEVGEQQELRLLEREEALAARLTSLTTRRRGDGTTEIRALVADAVADRLLTYLHAFTSPRHHAPSCPGSSRQRYDRRLGQAFGAFLESVDTSRLPLHGGDATAVMVTVDLETLRGGLGTALVGDQPVTAGEARRLACTAGVLPVVLGGRSEVLDLGRTRRLFSPAQRKALAVRHPTCQAAGCDVPAPWCEAHHAGRPWSRGGPTDLADGVLLCSHHHHRAHDHRYGATRVDDEVRFHRRT